MVNFIICVLNLEGKLQLIIMILTAAFKTRTVIVYTRRTLVGNVYAKHFIFLLLREREIDAVQYVNA